ncbi:hypothetical protein Atai01_05740 [Amycolatopsis taiwanensis]|uniref:Uncharacterized protein n=1 Tax=Amycolatopsis taiwanensis TaxID=342230 RepID=A0A9W6QXU8_9PSEU|nr:hypothetical protein Atai01_05740 [Amycolatopsis taiwanensis]
MLQVRVSVDPATGERLVLVQSVRIEKPGNERSERAARKEAEQILTRIQGEADSLKAARTKSTFGGTRPSVWSASTPISGGAGSAATEAVHRAPR